MKTASLLVLCEGVTELRFVANVLAPQLREQSVFTKPQLLFHPHGGVVPFETLRSSIKQGVGGLADNEYITTMIDLYRIGKFPGVDKRPGDTVSVRVARIESEMATGLPNPRFLPHVQLHEFEALLFVDLDQLALEFPGGEARRGVEALRREVRALKPEEIDEGDQTAPSKRIIRHIPEYKPRKATVGPIVAARIGLERLRKECPHFGAWIGRLEQLAGRG